MLVAAKYDICNRNRQKCATLKDVEGVECSVFASGHITQAVLSRLSEDAEYPVLPDINASIDDLSQEKIWSRRLLTSGQAAENKSPAAFAADAVYAKDTHRGTPVTESRRRR